MVMAHARSVPLRTCVVCRTKTTKRDLVRIVLTPGGACVVDETGKQPGRGAYLCHRPECWERAVSGDRLSHSLRSEINRDDREHLAAAGALLSAQWAAEEPEEGS